MWLCHVLIIFQVSQHKWQTCLCSRCLLSWVSWLLKRGSVSSNVSLNYLNLSAGRHGRKYGLPNFFHPLRCCRCSSQSSSLTLAMPIASFIFFQLLHSPCKNWWLQNDNCQSTPFEEKDSWWMCHYSWWNLHFSVFCLANTVHNLICSTVTLPICWEHFACRSISCFWFLFVIWKMDWVAIWMWL